MIKPEETRESYEERIAEENKKNWICLGEVEEKVFNKRFSCFECSDSPNNYLFIKKYTEHYFIYVIAPSYYMVEFINSTRVKKETSFIDFIKTQITDSYNFCEKNYPGNKSKFKIRLKGMSNWISPE